MANPKTLNLPIKAVVGDKVKIPTLECDSVVVGIYIGRYAHSYEVAYFHNGDRKTAYLYGHEFELTEPT